MTIVEKKFVFFQTDDTLERNCIFIFGKSTIPGIQSVNDF